MESDNLLLCELGKKIRKARLNKGLSQAELGKQCGLHPTYISQAETGKANLTIGSLKAIAENVGVNIKDLMPDDETELAEITEQFRQAYLSASDCEHKVIAISVRNLIDKFLKIAK